MRQKTSEAVVPGETSRGTTAEAPAGRLRGAARTATVGQRRSGQRSEAVGAAVLTAPYVIVMLIGGIIPAAYAIYQSFHNMEGSFGLGSYKTVVTFYSFADSFKHIGKVMIIWIPLMIIGVVIMALLVHASSGFFSGAMRFIYYLPGAFMGVGNFMLWLFLLDPSVSPFRSVIHWFGIGNLSQALVPTYLPFVLTIMLFFQGAGTWVVILFGGLNGISTEVLEAAKVDGCNGWQLAMHIKLPLIRPWVGYLALMNIAYGFQLFLEPELLSSAAHGILSPEWSPNQLSYFFAFGGAVGGIPAAAALSVILLAITLIIGMIIVTKSGLFEKE